jgi:Mg2+ and Co2+ transporter CorA
MFAGGGFVGSIWGMNLDSKLQETPGMFWGITGGTLGFMITTASCVLFYLKYSGVIPARLEGYKKVL